MLVSHCDRCNHAGQTVPVLGKDLCNACVVELREWMQPPPPKAIPSGRRRVSNRLEQAMHIVARNGYVSDTLLARANREPVRRAYFALMAIAKRGSLVHRGGGVFVRPQAEAAE